MRNALKELCSSFLRPAGININGSTLCDIHVLKEDLYNRILVKGSLGLGEAYVDGYWECPRLDEFFCRLFRSGTVKKFRQKASFNPRILALYLKSRITNCCSKERSFQVGEKHYNIGNELYEHMLDSRMIYSCGYFKGISSDEISRNPESALERAQENKLSLVCKKLMLEPGMKVLDIGCGWGGAAKFMAEKYSVSVVGLTVSSAQAELAKKNCKGLPIQILVKDYRNMVGEKFDRIYSIGMFEHVGYKNYRTYMEMVKKCLHPDGLFLLHTMGGKEPKRHCDPWFDKYIFPNGMIPSLDQIEKAVRNLFITEDIHNIGADYDKTLMLWHHNFLKNWEEIIKGTEDKYDNTFKRMWSYYLLSLAGFFRAREGQVWQLILSPNGVEGGYRSVR